MAIHIRLIKNNIKRSNSYGKYFAKAVSQGEVTFEELAQEAFRHTNISEGTAWAVITDLQAKIKEKLADGQTVVLPGIGRFSLRVESEGVEDPKKFSIKRHITRIICGFLPAGRRTHGHRISYDFSEGVKAEWEPGLKP